MSTSTPYDVNFCFPVRELENDRIKLTPFVPAQHSDLFFQGSSPYPELYKHLPFGPFSSSADLTERLIHGRIQPNPGMIIFAILDKTRSPHVSSDGEITSPSSADFAGTIGYLHGSPTCLSIEIGFIIVLPPFQRTHVTTNAIGLLLQYALDLPTASPSGLGLRRVQWQASERNDASIRVAEKMGFRREALLRWDRILMSGQGKVGNGEDIREGDPRPGTQGRHTVILGICWDDWENGWRDQVARLVARST